MIKSASLQPFTVEQWAIHQQDSIQLVSDSLMF